MRHKGVNKVETRQKMIAAASRGFRSNGYAGIGVDGLAKAAGVTSGAFYSHFGSKDAAFDVALATGLDEVIETIPNLQKKHGTVWVEAFAKYYMSKRHRGDLECGCAMATLTSEVVRSAPKVHAAFEKKMTLIADLVSQGLAGSSDEERRAKAWAVLGVLIGGINVARAMKGATVANEVAKATIIAAINVAR
jgi:TetR/AcrR family transcriptional repressor of nem operon